MIIFLTHERHTYTHRGTIGQPGLGTVACRSYRWLLNQHRPPRATYIFTDRERMDVWELSVYGAFYRHLAAAGPGYRVVNDPARMADRTALLRSLHQAGINDFNAYPVSERRVPARFPVFLRRQYDHHKPLTDLLPDQAALEQAITELRAQGEPEEGLLIIEYCAEPVVGDLYRKLSAYRVGDRVLFFNTVHERNWLVKYGTLNAADDALYAEEQRMILDNAYESEMREIFTLAGIDYGRADFGLVEGRVQVYEINSNPNTVAPKPHPNAIRTENLKLAWDRYCQALAALDTTDARAPLAAPFEHPAVHGRRMPWRRLRGRFIIR